MNRKVDLARNQEFSLRQELSRILGLLERRERGLGEQFLRSELPKNLKNNPYLESVIKAGGHKSSLGTPGSTLATPLTHDLRENWQASTQKKLFWSSCRRLFQEETKLKTTIEIDENGQDCSQKTDFSPQILENTVKFINSKESKNAKLALNNQDDMALRTPLDPIQVPNGLNQSTKSSKSSKFLNKLIHEKLIKQSKSGVTKDSNSQARWSEVPFTYSKRTRTLRNSILRDELLTPKDSVFALENEFKHRFSTSLVPSRLKTQPKAPNTSKKAHYFDKEIERQEDKKPLKDPQKEHNPLQIDTLDPTLSSETIKRITKLKNIFKTKYQEKPAFRDIFIDTDTFDTLFTSQAPSRLTEYLLMFILHSKNQKINQT